MSTTVTYKGNTLTTVDNETRTLLTSGKYMEDDLTLTDVSGSGSANIESLSITHNGTYTASGGVDGYSPITVNVSDGSDFSIAEVEITNNSEYEQHFEMINILDYGEENGAMFSNASVGSGGTLTFYVVMYRGMGDAFLNTDYPEDYVLTVTGDAEVSELEPFVNITGNCTITIDEIVQ